jgi:7-keto-8-aminopelargonate synthetase-like enzyme
VQHKIDPYQKYSTTRVSNFIEGAHRDGTPFQGHNFASQDYLSLASHPDLMKASIKDASKPTVFIAQVPPH